MIAWQYNHNEKILENIREEQESLQEIMSTSHFIEKAYYGNRKKFLETFEDNQINLKNENDHRHQAMGSALEIVQEIGKDPSIEVDSIYLEEGFIEIQGSATSKSIIDKHFSNLSIPHYGKFEPLEYDNYSQDRYRFILKNRAFIKGES